MTLDGAPTSLAGMVATAADAALAADVLGPRVRLALSATPGDKGATSLGLEAVSDTLTYDHMMECEATGIMSSSLRPKRRPEGLGE